VRGRTGDLAYVNVNVNVNVNGDLAYVMGRSGVTVEAVVSCVECVLVVGPCERQRIQGDIPPGRVCLKREDHSELTERETERRRCRVCVLFAYAETTERNARKRSGQPQPATQIGR
jgi:hypothetical protein